MKKNIKIIAGLLLIFSATISSCGKEDEVVPITESNTTSRTYKVADPVLLNSSEQDIVSVIRNEYYDNVEDD
jgi:hypothetical protein